MNQINGISLAPKQNITLALQDGSQAYLYMEYMDGQQGWMYNISYGQWSTGLRRFVVTANMLRAWKNIIPFGIGIQTIDGYEPIFISDFYNNRAQLFLLNSSDVQTFEGILNVN